MSPENDTPQHDDEPTPEPLSATQGDENPQTHTGVPNDAEGARMGEMSANEVWLPVLGQEHLFEVSNMGRVRSMHQKRMIRSRMAGLYESVPLRGRVARVHILVLEAFVGPRPAGQVARHLNDQRRDNRLENLAWGTHAQNRADELRNRQAPEANRLTFKEFHLSRTKVVTK